MEFHKLGFNIKNTLTTFFFSFKLNETTPVKRESEGKVVGGFSLQRIVKAQCGQLVSKEFACVKFIILLLIQLFGKLPFEALN